MNQDGFDADALRIDALDARRLRELLSAYLDGELSTEAALEVTAWLDDHPDALRDIEHLRRLWDRSGTGSGHADVPVSARGAGDGRGAG